MDWFSILGVLIAIIAIVPAITIYKFASIKLLSGEITFAEAKSVPSEQVNPLIAGELFIRKQGFSYRTHVMRGPVMKGQPWGLYGALYQHAQTNTWALIFVESLKHPVFDWRLILMTPDEGGGYAVTVSGDEMHGLRRPAKYAVRDAMTYSAEEQWRFHREMLQETPDRSSRMLDLPEVFHVYETVFFRGLIDTNTVVPWGDGYRLPLKHAFRVWKNLWPVHKRLLAQKLGVDGAGAGENSGRTTETAENQYAAYKVHKEIQENNKANGLSKVGILLISVVLFGISFGIDLSLNTLFLLIAVLFVHEAGHLLGMWMFGYKDLRMLFVPFMGALASGRKDHVNAWQEAMILLLGPLPGYALGILVLNHAGDDMPEWLLNYAMISLILNAINLLPVMPLDGGRLANLALFNRLPALQLVFMLISIVFLAYAGVAWGERAGLLIAFILVLSLPYLWKETRLLRYLLKQQAHKNYTGIKDLLNVLSHHDVWKGMLPKNRWPLLDSLAYRVQHANAGLPASAGILLLWLASISLPPMLAISDEDLQQLATAWTILSSDAAYQQVNEEMIERYRQTEDIEVKADIAMQLGMRLESVDREAALKYWHDLRELVAGEGLRPEKKGEYYYRMSGACVYFEEAGCEIFYLENSIDLLTGAGSDSEYLMLAYRGLAQGEALGTDDRLNYLDRAETVAKIRGDYESLSGEFHYSRSLIYQAGGDAELAERFMLKAVEASKPQGYPEAAYYFRELVALYMRRDSTEKSTAALKEWVSDDFYQPDTLEPLQENLNYVLVWLLAESDPLQAKEHLARVKPVNAVDKIELVLANVLIDEKLGKLNAAPEPDKLTELVNGVEDEYQWAYFAYYLTMNTSENSEDEIYLLVQYSVGRDWYRKLHGITQRSEFGLINQMMEKYGQIYSEPN